MRDPQTIEREIDVARLDLEANIAELKEVVRDKLDVKKRARHAIEQRKQQAIDLAHRGTHEVRELAQRARIGARERPVLAIAAAIGLLLIGVLLVHHRMHATGRQNR